MVTGPGRELRRCSESDEDIVERRMAPKAFHQLLDMITPFIGLQRQYTMTPYKMLALTLRYLTKCYQTPPTH